MSRPFVSTSAPAGAARRRRPAVFLACRFRSFLVRFGRKFIGRFGCIFLFVRCSVLLDLLFIILRCLFLVSINWCSRKCNTLYCAFVSASLFRVRWQSALARLLLLASCRRAGRACLLDLGLV